MMKTVLLGSAAVVEPVPRRADGALDVLPVPHWVRRLRAMGMTVLDEHCERADPRWWKWFDLGVGR